MTHTPGPWSVGKPSIWHGHGFMPIGPTRTASGDVASVTINYPLVASIHPENDTKGRVAWSPRDIANAQLIAAAPELLAELKHCVWLLRDLQPEPGLVQQQALAAIAKAEGRTAALTQPSQDTAAE